jgi:hypothetical protein
MTRGITSGMANVSVSAHIKYILLFAAYLDSGTLYAWSGRGNLLLAAQIWIGTGTFLKFDPIRETQEVQAEGSRFSLSGVPVDMMSLALSENFKNRKVECFFGSFDNSTGQVVEDPVLLFRGRMDVPELDEDEKTTTIICSAESRLIDLEIPREGRYTHEDQQIDFLGDKFFSQVPSLQEKQIIF